MFKKKLLSVQFNCQNQVGKCRRTHDLEGLPKTKADRSITKQPKPTVILPLENYAHGPFCQPVLTHKVLV